MGQFLLRLDTEFGIVTSLLRLLTILIRIVTILKSGLVQFLLELTLNKDWLKSEIFLSVYEICDLLSYIKNVGFFV